MGTVYFARWILLDNDEILENGALSVVGNKIVSVGPRSKVKRSSDDRIVNLGEILLLPGLINMHTHLEECVVRGLHKEQEETFTSFSLKKTSRLRQALEKTIAAGIGLTIRELLTNGITTVVDSSRLGISSSVLSNEVIRFWSIQEIHLDDPLQEEQISELITSRLQNSSKQNIGLAPYSLFSLSPSIQHQIINYCTANDILWGMHLAESAEELQAFSELKGDLYSYVTLKKRWPYGDPTVGSMQYALTENLVPNGAVLNHCNYVNGHELTLLAAKHVSIVLCFQYSAELGHKPFPLDVALNRGVNICLGTEGIIPAGFMDLFDELHALKMTYPHIPAKTMLNWVTKNPASALKMSHLLGSLSDGKFADIIGVRFAHDPKEDILEELMVEDPNVVLVIVDGEELIIDS